MIFLIDQSCFDELFSECAVHSCVLTEPQFFFIEQA